MRSLFDRVVGYFPLSIATSLAIEKLVGKGMDENGKIVYSKNRSNEFDVLWLNIRTLIRNIVGACEQTPDRIQAGDVAYTLTEELEHIAQILKEFGSTMQIMPYYCGYRKITKQYPKAGIRITGDPEVDKRTPKQQMRDRLFDESWFLTRALLQQTQTPFQYFDHDINKYTPQRTLMLTHYPIDLLAHKQFSELTLIESHTGAIKPRSEWNTKFYNGKELSMMPFNSATLQIFGDPETFKPIALKYRKAVLDVATVSRWTYLTTRDKMRFNFERIKDKDCSEKLLSYL